MNKKLRFDNCRLKYVGIPQDAPLSFYIRQLYDQKSVKQFYKRPKLKLLMILNRK